MIALNSAVLANSVYQQMSAPDSGALAWAPPAYHCSAIGLGALGTTLARIDDLYAAFLRTEDTPSEAAHQRIREAVRKANQLLPMFLEPSLVEEFEGDILIHWDTPQRNIVLVSPASGQGTLQLYRERLAGKQAVESNLIKDANPQDLANALAWVLAS
jgi:hypothetical protein